MYSNVAIKMYSDVIIFGCANIFFQFVVLCQVSHLYVGIIPLDPISLVIKHLIHYPSRKQSI